MEKLDGVEVVKHFKVHNEKRDFCVLGVLKTPKGLEIEKEMLEYLTKVFDVYAVRQDPPGKYFEYPAIKFAKEVSIKENDRCWYLHTKGAANDGRDQSRIRELWKREILNRRHDYMKRFAADKPIVVTQLTGKGRHTWYNMFVANRKAFELADLDYPNPDRMYYEHLFREIPEVTIKAMFSNEVTTDEERHAARAKMLEGIE